MKIVKRYEKRNKIKNKTIALCLGSIFALLLRYIAHIFSGAIFYGAWAEWFFSQEGFYAFGAKVLEAFSGGTLALIYSVVYNGLYMIPEIVITTVAAVIISRIPQIKAKDIA
jgi:thiamine transporter